MPIACSYSTAAYQNLAIFREFDFSSLQHLANRSFSQAKGMIHADERSSLGQSVSLNYGIAHPVPKFLRGTVERGSARNERPELPAEFFSDATKDPPPT